MGDKVRYNYNGWDDWKQSEIKGIDQAASRSDIVNEGKRDDRKEKTSASSQSNGARTNVKSAEINIE